MRWIVAVSLLWPLAAQNQDVRAGRREFESRCGACHGGDGGGGERGPSVFGKIQARSDADLAALIRQGVPDRGMPPIVLTPVALRQMTAFLRFIEPSPARLPDTTLRLAGGGEIRGAVANESNFDVQLRAADGRFLSLDRSGGTVKARSGDSRDWPTYHGHPSGNRHSSLDQIGVSNVVQLAPKWIFPMAGARLEVTPVVVDGVMYVTSVNECNALDAATGRPIWQYRRPRSRGLIGDASSGINRGVAIRGDRVFLVTDNAHLLALDRATGALVWDVEMADSRQHYGATGAPLVVGDLVISGISGGDEGVRGFLDAYDAVTGKRAWRFWTVPARGEPLADTWRGTALEHGCAATWMTGSYDPDLDLLYWSTGNPCPDYNGDERQGDNLYSNTVLALRPKTGALVWHYQFTPHDLHDWDAQQTNMLIDAPFGGRARKLLVHANRNGFFYVLDRTNGEVLLAKPFVKKLTWASEIRNGRPVLNPAAIPTLEGVKACPSVEGATNWFSTAYHPGTGLYYVQTLEECNIYKKTPGKWEPGKSYYDGSTREVPGEPGQKILRAIEVGTGRIAWEYPQIGRASSWGGVLSTAGGLVFFGEDSGAFAAVDATSGKPLWHFHTNSLWKASPMTYMVNGKQYVAMAAGSAVIAFGLP